MKKLIVYDLDGTLAESKSALDAEMAALLRQLLGIVKVAVISGGDWPQFEKQLLPIFPMTAAWRIYPSFQHAVRNFSSTQENGKGFIQKISLRVKNRKLSVLCRKRSQ